MSSTKRVFILLGLLFSLFIITAIFNPVEKNAGNKEEKITEVDKFLLKAANKINARLPLTVDSETRLDTTFGYNKDFRYNYTMINYTAKEVESNTDAFRLEQLKQLENIACSSKEFAIFFNKGVSITHAYHGKNGALITVITIPPSQCVNS